MKNQHPIREIPDKILEIISDNNVPCQNINALNELEILCNKLIQNDLASGKCSELIHHARIFYSKRKWKKSGANDYDLMRNLVSSIKILVKNELKPYESVIERLRKYRDDINELMDLIAGKRYLKPEIKRKAQELMKALKENLKRDYKKGATKRGEEKMTKLELQFFHPAIHEAYTRIQSRWNSNPITSHWLDQLYSANIDIEHYLGQLERIYHDPKRF